MSNPLSQLVDLVRDKKQYKIGKITSFSNNMYVVRDTSGALLNVTGGNEFTIGNSVLIENNRIVGKVSDQMRQVYVP